MDQIVSDLQQGIDVEEKFRRIFDHFHNSVYRFFARRGFPADECLDLTQETFLGVYKDIGSYRGESKFEAWLLGILSNIYYNALRRRNALKRSALEVSIDGAEPKNQDPGWSGLRAATDDPAEVALQRERAELLEQAIGELPPQMRRALILNVYHGHSYREVAEILGLQVNTVKTHLGQGRKKLLAALESSLSSSTSEDPMP